MGRHFLLLLEVKCCEEEKGLKEHRKKSVAQLKKHVAMMKEIFGSDEKAKKEIDKVILHTVWPNLSSKESCTKCKKGSHERFKKKPDNCRLAGQTQEPQYEEEGWHWFEEDLDYWHLIDILKKTVESHSMYATVGILASFINLV